MCLDLSHWQRSGTSRGGLLVISGRHTKMPNPLEVSEEDLARFWSRTQLMNNGCIVWTRGKVRGGYGGFKFRKKNWMAHRWIMAVLYGESDLLVLHTCPDKDNPSCVNPDHLRYGTHKDNASDAWTRGQISRPKRTHCKRGHKMTKANRYVRPDGTNECYTCRNMRNAYWNGKRDAERRAKK